MSEDSKRHEKMDPFTRSDVDQSFDRLLNETADEPEEERIPHVFNSIATVIYGQVEQGIISKEDGDDLIQYTTENKMQSVWPEAKPSEYSNYKRKIVFNPDRFKQ